MSTRTPRDRSALKAAERALRIVVVGIAALAALCSLVVVVSMASGARPLVFRSGSMSPAIPAGSLAFTRPADAGDLAVGDVVTVKVGSGRVTHRIVAVKHHGDVALLQLKGDANKAADRTIYPVREAQRTWFSVPMAGSVTAWLSRPVGGLSLAAYLLLVVLVVGRWRRALAPNAAPSAAFARRNRALAGGTAVLTFAAGAFGSWVMPTWAYWTDDANASSATISTGTWDVAPPASAVTNVTPLVNAAGWYKANITVSLTASDAAPSSGVAGIHYILNGGTEQVLSGSTGNVSITTEGTNTLEYWAVDNAGFAESPHHTATYKLDKTPPPAPVFSSISNDTGASSTDRITSAATQTLSGTAEANSTVTVSQGSSPLGTTTTDGSGHFSFGPVTLAPGANGFTATAKDVADNQSPTSANFVVTLDAVAPNSVVISPNDSLWHNTGVWTVTATDALSGVATVSTKVGSGSFTTTPASNGIAVSPAALPDGVNTVQAYATDVAGVSTSSTPTTATIRVDTVKPTAVLNLTGAAGNSPWRLSGAANVVGTDPGGAAASGVASVEYQVDSGSFTSLGSGVGFTIPEGTHNITYRAIDFAGNVGTNVVQSVSVDSATPSTSASASPAANAAGWNKSNVTVTFAPTDASPGSGVANVQYRTTLNGGSPSSFTSLTGPTYAATISAQGTTLVEYRATDMAGNVESLKNISVKVDTVLPTATLNLTGTNGVIPWKLAGTANIVGTDATSGVDHVEYQLDGSSTVNTVASGASFTIPDGTHNIIFRAVDVAGNPSADQSQTGIKIDSVGPALSNPLPADGAISSTWTAMSCASASNQICVNATDATSGIASGTVKVTLSASSGVNSGKCWAGGTSWTVACTPQTMSAVSGSQYATGGMSAATMPVGAYTATFDAKDVAGNSAAQLTVSFTVGTVPAAPVVTSCSAANGGSGNTVNWTEAVNPTTFEIRYTGNTHPAQSVAGNLRSVVLAQGLNNESGTFYIVAINAVGTSASSNLVSYSGNGSSKVCVPQ